MIYQVRISYIVRDILSRFYTCSLNSVLQFSIYSVLRIRSTVPVRSLALRNFRDSRLFLQDLRKLLYFGKKSIKKIFAKGYKLQRNVESIKKLLWNLT